MCPCMILSYHRNVGNPTKDCKKPEDLKRFTGTAEDPYVFDAAKSTEARPPAGIRCKRVSL